MPLFPPEAVSPSLFPSPGGPSEAFPGFDGTIPGLKEHVVGMVEPLPRPVRTPEPEGFEVVDHNRFQGNVAAGNFSKTGVRPVTQNLQGLHPRGWVEPTPGRAADPSGRSKAADEARRRRINEELPFDEKTPALIGLRKFVLNRRLKHAERYLTPHASVKRIAESGTMPDPQKPGKRVAIRPAHASADQTPSKFRDRKVKRAIEKHKRFSAIELKVADDIKMRHNVVEQGRGAVKRHNRAADHGFKTRRAHLHDQKHYARASALTKQHLADAELIKTSGYYKERDLKKVRGADKKVETLRERVATLDVLKERQKHRRDILHETRVANIDEMRAELRRMPELEYDDNILGLGVQGLKVVLGRAKGQAKYAATRALDAVGKNESEHYLSKAERLRETADAHDVGRELDGRLSHRNPKRLPGRAERLRAKADKFEGFASNVANNVAKWTSGPMAQAGLETRANYLDERAKVHEDRADVRTVLAHGRRPRTIVGAALKEHALNSLQSRNAPDNVASTRNRTEAGELRQRREKAINDRIFAEAEPLSDGDTIHLSQLTTEERERATLLAELEATPRMSMDAIKARVQAEPAFVTEIDKVADWLCFDSPMTEEFDLLIGAQRNGQLTPEDFEKQFEVFRDKIGGIAGTIASQNIDNPTVAP